MAQPTAGSEEKTLGQRVRRLRTANLLSQAQLAARMGLTQPRVSQIENDQQNGPLPLRTLRDLADGLGVDLLTLIAGDPLYDLDEIESPGALLLSSLHPTWPFIGRADDLAAVVAILGSNEVRLLTLVGPAGVGKTQLALHAAEAIRADFPDQVVAPLAACFDLASVLNTIARAAGLRERDAQPLRQRLVSTLRDRRLLLLLDNAEQALPAVATLAMELVGSCPRVVLLVTSRAPLNIRVEQTYTVPPLGVPAPDAPVTLASAAAAPAVQLFVRRAAAAVPGFSLSESKAGRIAAICRRLDGLPLAIELAAPRVRVLSLDQLLRQLDRRLALLTSGARDLPLRQQSLRANIAWSVDLLTPAQQALFRRIAVFAGGFTLDTASAVVVGDLEPTAQSSPAIPHSSADVAGGISVLIEHSLLTRAEHPNDEPRFAMLETIHEFAREQLEAAGELAEFRRRHLVWSLSLAERSSSYMFTAEEPAWLVRLQQENANLQSALGWAFGPGGDHDLEAGLRLAGALGDYWFLSGLLSEGRAWLTRAVALSTGRPPTLGRARSLIAAALIEQTQAAVEPAETHAEQGLAMARTLADDSMIGRALLLLGNVALMRGDLDRAQSLHAAAFACFRGLGDQSWSAVALLDLGLDAYHQERFQDAARYADEALALARDVGDRWEMLHALHLLGELAQVKGDLDRAYALFAECAYTSWQFGSLRDVADSLSGLGSVSVAAGAFAHAARFLGTAETLYRRLDIATPPPLRPNWQAIVDEVQRWVAPDALAAHWSSTTPEQAIREIIERWPPHPR